MKTAYITRVSYALFMAIILSVVLTGPSSLAQGPESPNGPVDQLTNKVYLPFASSGSTTTTTSDAATAMPAEVSTTSVYLPFVSSASPTALSMSLTAVAATTLTSTPTDDATIRESRPTANYGARPNLEVDADSRKDVLLRFDVSGVGGASVTNAKLRLYAIDGSSFGGEFFKMNESNWSEGTVTWASAPPGDGGSLGSLGSVSPGTWYELDVTSLVAGDGPVSIRINSTNSNGADYASKENSAGFAPELVVTLGQNP